MLTQGGPKQEGLFKHVNGVSQLRVVGVSLFLLFVATVPTLGPQISSRTRNSTVFTIFAVPGTWSLTSVRRSTPRIVCRSPLLLLCVPSFRGHRAARIQQTACSPWPQGITWDFTRALGLDIVDRLAMFNNPNTQELSVA